MGTFDGRLARLPAASPLPFALDATTVTRLDLSAANPALAGFDPGDTAAFSAFITGEMRRCGARCAVGGYGEHRTLYAMSSVFGSGEAEPRTLHLGIDLWLEAGTAIHAVLPGVIHSVQDNPAFGDYGPTVIVQHDIEGERLHTLYGHLARRTLAHLRPGLCIEAGQVIGWLGEPHENVGWPPHLHLQLIRDLGGRSGDYPGVCRQSESAAWLANCPDPNLLLRLAVLDGSR